MKTMMYIGAALMVGASIYGYANYEKARKKKEFSEMYKEPAPVARMVSQPEAPVVEKKAEVSKTTKTAATKVNEPSKKSTEVKTTTERKVTKKRKIRREFFSRGGLDDRFIEVADSMGKKKTVKEL